MSIVMCLSRGVCVATLPSEVAADRSVGFVRFWLYITLNSELEHLSWLHDQSDGAGARLHSRGECRGRPPVCPSRARPGSWAVRHPRMPDTTDRGF